jgi:hypothetical protein
MDHDHSYKLLCSHRDMMAALLRGFVTAEWVHTLDLTTPERVQSSQVSDDLRDRQEDIIWHVRWQGDWLYIDLLVEFQSTVYRYMAVQLMTYVGLLYEGLISSQQFGPTGDLSPVVPIVLYKGSDRWTAAQDIATLVAEAPGELNEGTIVASETLLSLMGDPPHPSPLPVAEGAQERLVLDTLVQDLNKWCNEPLNGLPGHMAVVSSSVVCAGGVILY